MAYLEDIETERTYPILEGIVNIIGKDADCHIKLDIGSQLVKQFISRKHAYILDSDGRFYLGDVSNLGTNVIPKRMFGYREAENVKSSLGYPEFLNQWNEFAKSGESKLNDPMGLKRCLFFGFLDEPGNKMKLKRDGYIVSLKDLDIIKLPNFKLKFRDEDLDR